MATVGVKGLSDLCVFVHC